MTAIELSRQAKRGPLKTAKFIVPVWGERYVAQFMTLALPTWLAPGNIPAVAKAIDAELVLLTNHEGEALIKAHPNFDEMSATVRIRLVNIDHLITATNHSTTITLAYEEAVRAGGEAALDTCFFFLVSDFIVADGSFRNAYKRIEDGYSGVLTGNFQVVAEDASDWFEAKLDSCPSILSLPPRELMRWGLRHLHPATIANTVNFPHCHNAHSNRLFWRVDSNTLLGRFYLMHMLCIRPEVLDFTIGSSCDYSFVPELCPSDNVTVISDSDEFLVIEMQPRQHEMGSMRLGPRDPIEFATTLGEWTTVRHRKNSQTTLAFHSADIPSKFADVQVEADAYLAQVTANLQQEPQPHRDHPYWQGAIAAWREAVGEPLSEFEWRMVLGYTSPFARKDQVSERLKQFAVRLLGRPPFVKAWHPRWLDYELILRHLTPAAGSVAQRQIRISDAPTVFTASTEDHRSNIHRVRKSAFLQRWAESYIALEGTFDIGLIELQEYEFGDAGRVVAKVAPLLKPGAKILISLTNRHTSVDANGIHSQLASLMARESWEAADAIALQVRKTGRLREAVHVNIARIGKLARSRPLLGFPILVAFGPPLFLAMWAINLLSGEPEAQLPIGPISSLLVVIDADAVQSHPASRREPKEHNANIVSQRHKQSA